MTLHYDLVLALLAAAVFVLVVASVYLILRTLRYRTGLALWGGLLLLSLSIQLGSYWLQVVRPPSDVVTVLFLIQVVSYTLFCAFWMLFVLTFTQSSSRVKRYSLIGLLGVPAVYLVLMLARWIREPVPIPAPPGETASLMIFPLGFGAPGALFIAYGYGVGFVSVLALLRFAGRSDSDMRKMALPFMVGPLLLAGTGFMELIGVNPFRPFSVQQLACASISILALLILMDLPLRSMLSTAHELTIHQMLDAVIILDRQDRIVDLNPAAQQLVGLSRSEARKEPVSRVWPAGASLFADRPGPDRTVEFSCQVNGMESTFDVMISPLSNAYREPTGRVIVLRNVTARERMEQELNRRTQMLMRVNAQMAALSEVNINLQQATDPMHIYDLLGSQLTEMGLACFIAQCDPIDDELRLVYLSIQPELISRIEKTLGAKVIGYRLDRDQFSPLYEVLETKEVRIGLAVSDRQPAQGSARLSAGTLERIADKLKLNAVGSSPALILPLVAGVHTLGVMAIWGGSLEDFDVSTFRIFANQVAHVIEKAKLYEAERQRSEELSHANNLVIALSKVASLMGSTSNSQVVLDTLGQELRKVGLNCAVAVFDPKGETAFIKYVSFSPDIIRMIEGVIRQPITQYAIPMRLWPGDRLRWSKSPIWYPDPGVVFRRMFPLVPESVVKQVFQSMGFSQLDQLCILPLIDEERVIGAIPIWGPALKPGNDAILSIFSAQVAGILRNVNNYELEVRRAGELERSNAMIVALSNVAARLDTTANLSQVYQTLGDELRKVRVNCLVGMLDEAKQSMRIDYISVPPDMIQWAARHVPFWPEQLVVPRHLWPTDVVVTNGLPYWDTNLVASTSRMFPYLPKKLLIRLFEMSGIEEEDRVCYLPMINDEDVIGILAVWGPDIRNEDIPSFSVFANQVATAVKTARLYQRAQQEVVERTYAEMRIHQALDEKEVLLKEIHHRVKNNLQVISSLLNLQAAQVADPNAVNILRESQNRVRTMALIHEKLYQAHDLARVDFAGYLNSLVNSLSQTYRVEAERVALHVHSDPVALNIDTAIPCGLIVNELVSNSLKHAFPNHRPGNIEVSFRYSRQGRCSLVVSDDGTGLPAAFDLSASNSLGLKLVSSLVKQIDGQCTVSSRRGTSFEITFDASAGLAAAACDAAARADGLAGELANGAPPAAEADLRFAERR